MDRQWATQPGPRPAAGSRAVIWDLDGVIVASAPYHYKAWRQLFAELGRAYTEAEFWQAFGRTTPDILRVELGPTATPTRVAELGERKEVLFRRAIAESVQPLPGAIDLIGALRGRGFRQAIASSAAAANVRLILTALRIADRFEATVSGEDIHYGKPDPECFLLAAERLGTLPRRCLVVEDAVAGILAARSAGMRCLAVTGTAQPGELAAAGADRVVESLVGLKCEEVGALMDC